MTEWLLHHCLLIFFFSLRTILYKSFCLSHFDTQHLKAPLSSANERVLFRETGTKISQEPPHQRAIKRTHRREGIYIHGITHFCLQEQHTYCAELSHLFCLFSFVLYKVLMKKREKFYDDAHMSGVQYFVSMYSHCLRVLFVLHHNFFVFPSNVVAFENNVTLILPRVPLPDYRNAGEHCSLYRFILL